MNVIFIASSDQYWFWITARLLWGYSDEELE